MQRLTGLLLMLASLAAMADCASDIPDNAPDHRYKMTGDGTVVDEYTELMWKRCSEGQDWDGAQCNGVAMSFPWMDAFNRAEEVNAAELGQNLGYQDWRLPNVKELMSLIRFRCTYPALNQTAFPDVEAEFTVHRHRTPWAQASRSRFISAWADSGMGPKRTNSCCLYVTSKLFVSDELN